MTSIRIFDTSLNQIAVLDNYASAFFERRWHEDGSFSFQTNENTLFAEEIQLDRIVMFSDDPYKCGIIEEVIREEGPSGKGSMVVTAKGSECKSMFRRRFVRPPSGYNEYTDNQDAEGVLKNLVKTQIGSSAETARQVSNLTIATDQARGATYVLSTRWKNLSETLSLVSLATGVGHFVYLDLVNKKFVYEIGIGVDRRSTQSVNGRTIFSSDYDTIESARLTKSNVKNKNLIYIGGRGVGTERLLENAYVGTEPSGLDRKEYFYDSRTIDNQDKLREIGLSKLEEMRVDTYVEGAALTYSQLVYGVDYDLGDLVTFETYGETIQPRIVGVTESWAPNSYRIDLAFDRDYPEASRAVQSSFSDLSRIMNQTELEFDARVTTDGDLRVTSDGSFRRVTNGL